MIDQTPPTIGERLARIIGAVSRDPAARADFEMSRLLDELKGLGAELVEDLTPEEARRQPSLADAARSLLAKAGGTPDDLGVTTEDLTYRGAEGDLPARLYRPRDAAGPLPTLLYFHGGGFVYGDFDAYDGGPRAMAAKADCLVVSAHYRLAPEHKFPAAHDDAAAAWDWLIGAAAAFGGDGTRFAVMGESAGANLAAHVSISARDRGLRPPARQALVYPIAGSDLSTESYRLNADARPLGKELMLWIFGHALLSPAERFDPRIDLVNSNALAGLPPTTIVTADIDPLRSEGLALAEKLETAGVAVETLDYAGVTHGFFGLTDVVGHAREAQDAVGRSLKAAFGQG
ncbi:alpha/beta hydrolase fold domain-containing protein [Hansschlegelia quercus]|uniref:Alpha/beta hydrolase n=1 Tax=Hansschlegelia quercus TaxID=2528245 RepID=A0A4Q9GGD8_9HYPH|nr:alpha/beta hydrolase [Hansschlegelia quercus]TBN52546.1 alpha/beta hydrolase [Hansschlegelia quercus]